jgi:hypothetical protein
VLYVPLTAPTSHVPRTSPARRPGKCSGQCPRFYTHLWTWIPLHSSGSAGRGARSGAGWRRVLAEAAPRAGGGARAGEAAMRARRGCWGDADSEAQPGQPLLRQVGGASLRGCAHSLEALGCCTWLHTTVRILSLPNTAVCALLTGYAVLASVYGLDPPRCSAEPWRRWGAPAGRGPAAEGQLEAQHATH